MPSYKLVYFKGPGRAEVTRILFTMAGQEFEDKRIAGDDWQAYKPKTPMGQMPVLEVDGTMICQSHAIARFVARKFGLGGKNELDQAKVDMVVDCWADAVQPMIAVFSLKSDEEKAAAKTKFAEETFPASLEKIEKLLGCNKGGNSWFVGDEMTWADVEFYCVMALMPQMGMTIKLDKYPKLAALEKRVEAHPKVAEWNAKKPKPQ